VDFTRAELGAGAFGEALEPRGQGGKVVGVVAGQSIAVDCGMSAA
jgi:hypothetical protein